MEHGHTAEDEDNDNGSQVIGHLTSQSLTKQSPAKDTLCYVLLLKHNIGLEAAAAVCALTVNYWPSKKILCEFVTEIRQAVIVRKSVISHHCVMRHRKIFTIHQGSRIIHKGRFIGFFYIFYKFIKHSSTSNT